MKNTRSTYRYPVSLCVRITHKNEIIERELVNLSVGGARVAELERLPIGTTLALSFLVPTSDVAIDATATVRWSNDESTGVQFDGLRAREVWSINEYFKQLG